MPPEDERRGVMDQGKWGRAAYAIAVWVTAVVFVGGATVAVLGLLGVVLRAFGLL